jgi:hypothetical protein
MINDWPALYAKPVPTTNVLVPVPIVNNVVDVD